MSPLGSPINVAIRLFFISLVVGALLMWLDIQPLDILKGIRAFFDQPHNREVVEPGHRVMETVIRRGIDRGEFRAVDVPSAVHSLLLPLIMLCVHRHSLGACEAAASIGDPLVFIRAHFELLLHGLRQVPDIPSGASGASGASKAQT